MGGASYPIGVRGCRWGAAEVAKWRARQSQLRSYVDDVVTRIDALADRFERIEYGQLSNGTDRYDLHALRSRDFDPILPTALVTGGVHGYETSGVMGALALLERHGDDYAGRINLLVAPCVSPWSYERINRWNYDAVDPNRNFRTDGPSGEARALIDLVQSVNSGFLVHIDLHETTDTDETEFRPALAARDGKRFEPDVVPDGFYLVADSADRQLAFQQAIIAAVEPVTHIAPPDADGNIIGTSVLSPGVVEYPVSELALCTSITDARFRTTTEVYPDSPRSTPEICVAAQVAAVRAAFDFALSARP